MLREHSLLSLETGRLWVDLIDTCQCLLGGCWEDGARLFTQWCMMGGQETTNIRWKKERFLPDISKIFFSIRIIRQWNRLPRKTVPSPSLEILKIKLAKGLSHLLWSQSQPSCERRVRQDDCLRSPPSRITLWFCNCKSLSVMFRKKQLLEKAAEILHADEHSVAVWKILRLVQSHSYLSKW